MNWNIKKVDILYKEPHKIGILAGKTKLKKMHSDWILYCWDNKKNVSLQSHRGAYKTTAIPIIGSIRNMLFFPDQRIAIIRKTHTDACEVVKTIENIMDLPVIKSLFKYVHGKEPKANIRRYGKLEYNFKKTITPEGSIQAHGLDTGLTGKHFDRIILDDFVTVRDRLSKAERRKAKEVLREIQTNIIDPGKPVTFIGTPWHRDDAWQLCPEPLKLDVYKTGLLTEEEIEEKKGKTTTSLFCANYELKHIADESKMFSDPKYKKWKPNNVEVWGHLDAAFQGKHTNGLTFIAQLKDGSLQCIGFSYSGNVKDWFADIKKLYKKYNCRGLYLENNPDKGYTADRLAEYGLNVISYSENMNKFYKIGAYVKEFWNTLYFASLPDEFCTEEEEWRKEYMLQITDYTEGQEPDDSIDSLASLLKLHYADTEDILNRL